MHRILYLGLDPSRYLHEGNLDCYLVHCPIIETISRPLSESVISSWSSITHVLFTSRSAVEYWPLSLVGKVVIAIGSATAEILDGNVIVAPYPTQEGVVALLESMDLRGARILWPRSSKSRDCLSVFFEKAGLSVEVFDLYDTRTVKLDALPDLNFFDEVVFTSPSTVDAFYELFLEIPKGIRLTPIGPVTARKLCR
jgi:uroporphyrinogen-III synthase